MKKAQKEKRYRRFDVQRNFYYETHDENGNLISDITEDEWRKKIVDFYDSLQNDNNVLEVAYVFHDKDLNSDGTSKGLHCHSVTTFKDAKTQISAVKFFNASSVFNCQPVNDYAGSMQYLIHVSQSAIKEMKTIYLPEIVHGFYKGIDGTVYPMTVRAFQERMAKKQSELAKKEQKKVRDSCLADIMNGQKGVSDVREIYVDDNFGVGLSSLDYLSDKRLLKEANAEWLERITEFYQSHPCPKTLIYISGSGGTGKTTLANAFADTVSDIHGIHNVSSPGKSTTFDFAGNYSGERVSIFNELAPAFPIEQFLSIFDTLNAVPVNSRHNDKLYFANYCLFTSSVPLESFIYNLWKPYARDNAIIPHTVRKQLLKETTHENDWLNAYLRYLPVGDDKILQIRRRIAIQVFIDKSRKTVKISVLDCKHNSANCFAFKQPAVSPYVTFNEVPYDVTDLENIDKQTEKAVEEIHKAIDYYYELNGFKNPECFETPDFDKN